MTTVKIPLHIVYVMDDSNTYDQELSNFCNSKELRFTTRLYDSLRYSDDRINIKDLPAIHLYLKKSYKDTIYPSEELFDTLTARMNEYAFTEKKREQQKKKWKDTLSSLFKPFVRPAYKGVVAETPKITINPLY